jgi:hypothetical protein
VVTPVPLCPDNQQSPELKQWMLDGKGIVSGARCTLHDAPASVVDKKYGAPLEPTSRPSHTAVPSTRHDVASQHEIESKAYGWGLAGNATGFHERPPSVVRFIEPIWLWRLFEYSPTTQQTSAVTQSRSLGP